MSANVNRLQRPVVHPQAIQIVGMLLCTVLLSACTKTNDGDTAVLVTVQAEHPAVGEISEHIVSDGTLFPVAQAAISPKITAPVRTFYVQRGSKVKAGQPLAVLENRDLSAQALDNKGQYAAAQASFDIQTEAQVPEDFHKAELDVTQAKAQFELQKQIVAARQKLFAEGAIPGRDYDTAAAALVQAQAAYDVARYHMDSLKDVSRAATLEQAEGLLSSAKGKYLAAEAQVSYSEVRSPISGVVTDRPLFAGETANAGSALITVMDTSSLIAKVHLSQTVAQQVKPGDTASVVIPGTEGPVPARISLVSPALDPGSTTVEVWIRIDNHAGKYRAGTSVETSIKGRTVANAVKVPLSAILTAADGSKSVMVVGTDGAAHKTTVQLGISDGEDCQVTRGLDGSETVITTGGYGLDDGTKVKIGRTTEGEDKAGGEAK